MIGDPEPITADVVDVALSIHRRLGPGLLESVYQSVLARQLAGRGWRVARQKAVAFEFEGEWFSDGLRVDLLVNGLVVVEVKAVETLAPVHFRQVLTYLRLLELPVGMLVNFGGATMKEGVRRIVNGYTPAGPSRLRIHGQQGNPNARGARS